MLHTASYFKTIEILNAAIPALPTKKKTKKLSFLNLLEVIGVTASAFIPFGPLFCVAKPGIPLGPSMETIVSASISIPFGTFFLAQTSGVAKRDIPLGGFDFHSFWPIVPHLNLRCIKTWHSSWPIHGDDSKS
eukprot:Gb_03796 [translate_table: standard]